MKKNILVIHPEGNVHNNPNLLAIVCALCESGYHVDIFSIRNPAIFQGKPCADSEHYLFENPKRMDKNLGFVSFLDLSEINENTVISFARDNMKKYDLIIGVDRGIIEASILAKIQRVPLALISYEIFYADETGSDYKAPEKDACRNVSFAVCQDPLRSRDLADQNGIKYENIIQIPVIGRTYKQATRSRFMHDKLSIPYSKKIALYAGSLSKWSGTDYLLESVKTWNDDWVLVIHARYRNDDYLKQIDLGSISSKVYFSYDAYDSVEELSQMLGAVDIGISYYHALYDSIYTGKNLDNIGLASGKTFTYLQHGLPVCVNEPGELADMVKKHSWGISYDKSAPLKFDISEEQLEKYRRSIQQTVPSLLDFNRLFAPVLAQIDTLTGNESANAAARPETAGEIISNEKNEQPVNTTHVKPAQRLQNPAARTNDNASDVKISLLLPTKGRSQLLGSLLNSISPILESGKLEVLLLYKGSEQEMKILQNNSRNIRLFNEDVFFAGRPTWPQMMNFLLEQAAGQFFMFASDDAVFERDAFENALALLQSAGQSVAGAAMAYRNAVNTEPDWKIYGIDLTLGNRLLINYGLIDTKKARSVGAFSEEYQFYCADGDLCFKLYKQGWDILPCFESRVIHFNIFDEVKQSNNQIANADIAVYNKKWGSVFRGPQKRRRIFNADGYKELLQENSFDSARGLFAKGGKVKLHLGCGQKYMDDYINIDYPPSEHTVQQNTRVDFYADLITLNLPPNSVDEIRLHHVFEHFDRSTALALLTKWNSWLKIGGKLMIETPDFMSSIELIARGTLGYPDIQVVLRHLFGSHEAFWAVHYDGWYDQKFARTLEKYGFGDVNIEKSSWKMTYNITVSAVKKSVLDGTTAVNNTVELLRDSMVDASSSEVEMLKVWLRKYADVIERSRLIDIYGEKTTDPAGPEVCIFMPVYNGARYIAETLRSLLNQTYRNFELIIADDGSTDDTVKIAESFARTDSRVRLLKLNHQGEVNARNMAIAAASAEVKYFLNHDSDDISMPSKLQVLVNFLQSNPDVAIVGCDAEYFDDAGKNLGAPKIYHDPAEIAKTFGQLNSMINSAALIRKGTLIALNGYREEYRGVDDYDFFARSIMAGYNLANVNMILHRIRLHPNSIGSTRAEAQKRLAANIQHYYNTRNMAAAGLANQPINTKKLNILITVEFYHPHTGGAEIVAQKIAENLVMLGHNITIATSKDPGRDFNTLNGVRIKEFDVAGNYPKGYSGPDAQAYVDFLAEEKFDVIFNYAAQQWATDLAFLAMDKTSLRPVHVIAPCGYSALADTKTLRWPEFLEYFTKVIPSYVPKYDAAVYHSALYTDYLFGKENNFGNEMVIHNGVDMDEFEKIAAIDFRKKYNITSKYLGICVANYFENKGQETLIREIEKMGRPDFTFVFIGKIGDQLERYKSLASACRTDIRFLSGISRQDTVAAFKAADLFMFASVIEASPLVIIEAKAAGTAFISTNCGNVKEWKGGIICGANEIALNANKLLDNEELRLALAEEGYNEVKDKLNWQVIAKQYEELFLSLHDKKNPAGTASDNDDINAIQRMIDAQPNNAELYARAARYLFNMGQYAEALKYIEDGLELQHDNTELNNLLNRISG